MPEFSRRDVLGFALAAACASAPLAHAAEPVKIIANYPPGASLDSLARAYAEGIREVSGDIAVVDNRAGANGNIGAAAAVQAPGDGKTLLVTPDAVVTANPFLYKNSGFDIARLVPVGMLSFQPSVLVVRNGSPMKNVAGFIKEAKKGILTYASAGPGSGGHLTMGYLISVAGLKMTHIPYKGGAPALMALMAGEVDSAFLALGNAMPLIKQGKLTALAVSSKQRLTELPQVPTMTESGYPDFVVVAGNMVMVPASASPAVREQLSSQLQKIVRTEQFKRTVLTLGMEPASFDTAGTERWLSTERSRWQTLIDNRVISAE